MQIMQQSAVEQGHCENVKKKRPPALQNYINRQNTENNHTGKKRQYNSVNPR